MTTYTKPHGLGGERGANFEYAGNADCMARLSQLYGTSKPSAHLPKSWRDRLPDPASYYRQHLECLGQPNADGFAKARCPFHDDHHPSLSVCLQGRGHWQCYAGDGCGHGDMVAFHMKRTGLTFKQAVRDLIGLGVSA